MSVKPQGKEDDRYELELKKVVYTLEKATASMFPGNEKWIWMLDLRHFSFFNSTPLSMAKNVVEVFSYHFPERLHMCFFIDAPWAFRCMWTLLTPFLDEVTLAKVNFIQDRETPQFKETMNKYFELDQLEQVLGGTVALYNADELEHPGPLLEVLSELREQTLERFRESKVTNSLNLN